MLRKYSEGLSRLSESVAWLANLGGMKGRTICRLSRWDVAVGCELAVTRVSSSVLALDVPLPTAESPGARRAVATASSSSLALRATAAPEEPEERAQEGIISARGGVSGEI
jgi:hypothetical protein